MSVRFKSGFNIFVVFALLVVLFGVSPVSSVRAEEEESPLAASGDFAWAKSIGGIGYDGAYGMALDSSGNLYIAGGFQGTVDFDPGPNTFNLTGVDSEIFVSKFDSNGNFIWAKSMGGGESDIAADLQVDSNGNIYITGHFYGTVDLDPGAGTFNLTSVGQLDFFISKLDNNGNLIWAKRIGGLLNDQSHRVFVDPNGNVYTAGLFGFSSGGGVLVDTVDFDPGPGTYNLTSTGYVSSFVSKLDSNGNFVWAKGISGVADADVRSFDLTVDSNNNVYIAGEFTNTVDFDPGGSTFNLSSATNGFSDIFISKLDSNGNFLWAKSMGGTGYDRAHGIVLDSSGNIYTAGFFLGAVDFDPGIGIINLVATNTGTFVSKLDSNGNFIWAKSMSGGDSSSSSGGKDIAFDSKGNLYLIGGFDGTVDFDPGATSFNLTSVGYNIFISKLDSGGNFIWAKGMNATQVFYYSDGGIALDSIGSIYLAGAFEGTVDFDPGPNAFNLTSAGSNTTDIFIAKLEGDSSGTPTFADVPFDHPLHDYIEALYDAGFTGGCSTSPLMFCPDQILDRAQSAVFMLRGAMGSGYTPPPTPWNTFVNESWVGFEWAQGWAEGMYQEGLTTGCQASPLKFCPANQLPRIEASIFGLKMKYGVDYTPPLATGTLFADFPSTDPSYWGIAWAEKAYIDGLLPACGIDSVSGKPMFCPGELVNRAWGAYLIVKAKGLPLP